MNLAAYVIMSCQPLNCDVVAVIAAFAPDPRPLLLTCRAYYVVFTEMPDIAYWCSGRDLAYLLPKHIPEVWDGYPAEIIAADNVAVFKTLPPLDVDILMRFIAANDAVNIFRHVQTVRPAEPASLICARNAVKCAAELGTPCQCGNSSSRMTGLLYKLYGKKGISSAIHLSGDLALLTGTFDSYTRCAPFQHVMRTIVGMSPRPPLSLKLALSRGEPDDIKMYIQVYKPPITPVLIAVAAAAASPRVFMYLYNLLGRDLPLFARISFDKYRFCISDAAQFEFYRECGCKITFITHFDLKAVDYFIDTDLPAVVANLHYLEYSRHLAQKLAARGVVFTPTLLSSTENWADVMYGLEQCPELVDQIFFYSWPYHTVRRRIEYLKSIPGSAGLIASIEDWINLRT